MLMTTLKNLNEYKTKKRKRNKTKRIEYIKKRKNVNKTFDIGYVDVTTSSEKEHKEKPTMFNSIRK